MDKQYWIMDGRANHSIDDAIDLVTCDTFVEAMIYIDDYGSDICIVEVLDQSQSLVYSLLWDDEAKAAVQEKLL